MMHGWNKNIHQNTPEAIRPLLKVGKRDKFSVREKNAGIVQVSGSFIIFAYIIATTLPTIKYSNYTTLLEIH